MTRRRGPRIRRAMTREQVADEIESIVYATDGGPALAQALGHLCRRLRAGGPDAVQRDSASARSDAAPEAAVRDARAGLRSVAKAMKRSTRSARVR